MEPYTAHSRSFVLSLASASTLEAFSIDLTTRGGVVSVQRRSFCASAAGEATERRSTRSNLPPVLTTIRVGVLLKGIAVLVIRDGSHTAFPFALKQTVHPGN